MIVDEFEKEFNTFRKVAEATTEDPHISKVRDWVESHWPKKVPKEFNIFFKNRLALSVQETWLMGSYSN